jgi:beta-aspartyl-peptidase (threonine type)
MKKSLFTFIAALFLAATISAQVAPAKRTVVAGKPQAVADILLVMDRQVQSWNLGDIDGFMLGYWNSPKLVFVSGDNITRGWQPTLERYKKTYGTKAKMGKLEFRDVSVDVIAPDAAVVLGSWMLTREQDTPKGKFTLVFKKFPEGWRIVHDHTS